MGMPSSSISEGMRVPSVGASEVDADQIPPLESYIVPQAFKGSDFEGRFRSWACATQLTQDEAAGVAAALDRYSREGTDASEWPEHIAALRLRLLEEGFNATPEGRATLANARAVFADMRRSSPDLAELIVAAGAAADPDVVRTLARLARG
jgi:hypothetical protein